MIEVFAVYVPFDGYSLCLSRTEADARAREEFGAIDPGEGWPDDIEQLGVYRAEVEGEGRIEDVIDELWEGELDWSPVWRLREKPGSRCERRECTASEPNADGFHPDDCATCEGSGSVTEQGEPWRFNTDFDYIVEYECPPLEAEAAR